MKYFFILVLFITAAALCQTAAPPPTSNYNTMRINRDLTIDGVLDEPEWKLVPKGSINYEISPGDNLPAKQKTDYMIVYNDTYIYFAFICHDTNPSQIRANLSDRDKIYNDDFAVIMLDPDMDNQRMYEFLINPFGVQADLIKTPNNEDDSFDAVWHSAGKIIPDGYVVEVAIPFKSLRFPARDVQTWGFILGRIYPRDSRYQLFSMRYDRNSPCFGCQGGVLTGISGIKSPMAIEVLPYVLGSQHAGLSDDEDQYSNFEKGKLQGRAGVGVKFYPTSNITIEAVANPDFSQVETDAQQISANQTFSLYYAEKRPFFFEGNEIFTTKFTSFYSRTINNPLYAAKLTGKNGSLSYAILSASDRNSIFIVPGKEASESVATGLNSYSNVIRSRYNLGGEDYIGGILTDRFYQNGGNHVGGIDWTYTFWKNYYFNGQLLYSHTKELIDLDDYDDSTKFGHTGKDAALNGESYNGTAVNLYFSQQTRSYWYEITYNDVSPAFQSQLGYITQTDYRTAEIDGGWTFYYDSSFARQNNVWFDGATRFDHESQTIEHYLVLGSNWQFAKQLTFQANYYAVNDEIFHGVKFSDVHRLNTYTSFKPMNEINFSITANFGRYIYRDDEPKLGYGHRISLTTDIKPTEKFICSFSFDRSRLADCVGNELFYDGYILRNVSTYQFNKEMYARLISEYNSFDKSVAVFPLFSYKLNPFTIFYIGSTYNLTDFERNPGVDNSSRYLQTARQYFVKLQYLWGNNI
jgi:hypothetical protein